MIILLKASKEEKAHMGLRGREDKGSSLSGGYVRFK